MCNLALNFTWHKNIRASNLRGPYCFQFKELWGELISDKAASVGVHFLLVDVFVLIIWGQDKIKMEDHTHNCIKENSRGDYRRQQHHHNSIAIVDKLLVSRYYHDSSFEGNLKKQELIQICNNGTISFLIHYARPYCRYLMKETLMCEKSILFYKSFLASTM